MGLSREERRALEDLEKRLALDEPELDALLSGSVGSSLRRRSAVHVWLMLMLLTCAIFMMGIVLLLTTGERECPGVPFSSCEGAGARQEG
ncbi:DUF3040 domain-containing protein [Nonomuraea sp. NPDC049419]|uniref:DUF3040 domain-containing protein n=1 Tax=Nonomuraea sp. NPDC049419 TaxID=3155772 RepID=UPI00341F58CF